MMRRVSISDIRDVFGAAVELLAPTDVWAAVAAVGVALASDVVYTLVMRSLRRHARVAHFGVVRAPAQSNCPMARKKTVPSPGDGDDDDDDDKPRRCINRRAEAARLARRFRVPHTYTLLHCDVGSGASSLLRGLSRHELCVHYASVASVVEPDDLLSMIEHDLDFSGKGAGHSSSFLLPLAKKVVSAVVGNVPTFASVSAETDEEAAFTAELASSDAAARWSQLRFSLLNLASEVHDAAQAALNAAARPSPFAPPHAALPKPSNGGGIGGCCNQRASAAKADVEQAPMPVLILDHVDFLSEEARLGLQTLASSLRGSLHVVLVTSQPTLFFDSPFAATMVLDKVRDPPADDIVNFLITNGPTPASKAQSAPPHPNDEAGEGHRRPASPTRDSAVEGTFGRIVTPPPPAPETFVSAEADPETGSYHTASMCPVVARKIVRFLTGCSVGAASFAVQAMREISDDTMTPLGGGFSTVAAPTSGTLTERPSTYSDAFAQRRAYVTPALLRHENSKGAAAYDTMEDAVVAYLRHRFIASFFVRTKQMHLYTAQPVGDIEVDTARLAALKLTLALLDRLEDQEAAEVAEAKASLEKARQQRQRASMDGGSEEAPSSDDGTAPLTAEDLGLTCAFAIPRPPAMSIHEVLAIVPLKEYQLMMQYRAVIPLSLGFNKISIDVPYYAEAMRWGLGDTRDSPRRQVILAELAELEARVEATRD